jgi:hypothetical protein
MSRAASLVRSSVCSRVAARDGQQNPMPSTRRASDSRGTKSARDGPGVGAQVFVARVDGDGSAPLCVSTDHQPTTSTCILHRPVVLRGVARRSTYHPILRRIRNLCTGHYGLRCGCFALLLGRQGRLPSICRVLSFLPHRTRALVPSESALPPIQIKSSQGSTWLGLIDKLEDLTD